MAKACKCRSFQIWAAWFLLLSITAMKTEAMDTVNVVDFCGQTVQGDGMIVRSHQESRKYYFVSTNTDCHLTIQAATLRDKVQFHFRFFLVYSLLRVSPFSAVPHAPESARGPSFSGSELRMEPTPDAGLGDPCHAGSYIQFYDGRDKMAPPIGPPLCGKNLPRPVLSTGNYLTLRLVTRGTQPRVDLVGDFTSFRLGFNQSECRSEPYFTCHNGKCIPMSLVCNDDKGIDNCGDGSDLQEYPGCTSQLSTPSVHQAYVTPPVPMLTVPTLRASISEKCSSPNPIPDLDSVTVHPGAIASPDPGPYVSLLALYVVLGVVVGSALVCWCCWSPGWFLWRVSVCRFLPCCNSCCASCQLCGRSCSKNKEHRLAKVTPLRTTTPAASITTVAV